MKKQPSKASKKAERFAPTIEWETRSGYPRALVVGVDEVGRGCLAGPVVAGAVVLPEVLDFEAHPWLKEVTDSKELSPAARERLAPLIEGWARASGIGVATVEEIDRINIYHAAHLAMIRAVEAAVRALDREKGSVKPAHVLVDGNVVPRALPCPATAIVKGDLKCLSIAAGSIIAKVWRDRWMVESESRYPGYGFAVHKGYATPTHSAALKAQGACAIHRRSFAPVAAVLGKKAPAPGLQETLELF